jgi:hypothetical protein
LNAHIVVVNQDKQTPGNSDETSRRELADVSYNAAVTAETLKIQKTEEAESFRTEEANEEEVQVNAHGEVQHIAHGPKRSVSKERSLARRARRPSVREKVAALCSKSATFVAVHTSPREIENMRGLYTTSTSFQSISPRDQFLQERRLASAPSHGPETRSIYDTIYGSSKPVTSMMLDALGSDGGACGGSSNGFAHPRPDSHLMLGTQSASSRSSPAREV